MCHLYVQKMPGPTGKLVSSSLPCHCQTSDPWCSNISSHLLSLSSLLIQTPYHLVQSELPHTSDIQPNGLIAKLGNVSPYGTYAKIINIMHSGKLNRKEYLWWSQKQINLPLESPSGGILLKSSLKCFVVFCDLEKGRQCGYGRWRVGIIMLAL